MFLINVVNSTILDKSRLKLDNKFKCELLIGLNSCLIDNGASYKATKALSKIYFEFIDLITSIEKNTNLSDMNFICDEVSNFILFSII